MRTGTRCPRCQPAWEGGSQATSALALVFCKPVPSITSSLATANAKLCKFSIKPRFNLFIFNALLGALIPVFLGAPRCFLRLDAELNPPPPSCSRCSCWQPDVSMRRKQGAVLAPAGFGVSKVSQMGCRAVPCSMDSVYMGTGKMGPGTASSQGGGSFLERLSLIRDTNNGLVGAQWDPAAGGCSEGRAVATTPCWPSQRPSASCAERSQPKS